MSRVHFFATRKDILSICDVVEQKLDLKILRAFQVPTKQAKVPAKQAKDAYAEYYSFRDIPDLGKANGGNRKNGPCFVLVNKSIDVPMRNTTLAKAPYIRLWAVNKEEAVSFCPGGEYRDDGIIFGEVMTEFSCKESERIVRAFRTAMKKQFGIKARGAWVGPEALERLKAGARLTDYYDHPDPEIIDIKISEIEVVS